MDLPIISFNRPSIVGQELEYIRDAALNKMSLCGNGHYTKRCSGLLEEAFGLKKVLLTHSCTGALEMASLLLNLEPGDEVIVPSYTFVSSVNPFLMRGAIPRFIDIRPDTLNMDERLLEQALSSKTKAVCVVHYAGVGAEMTSINEFAGQHGLQVVEDAAQGVDARYRGKPLGGMGDLGAFSFHETKNYISGEGGALVVNQDRYLERAEVLLEKGTNRKRFLEGQVDKYTWVDLGSSFVLSEINAAFLCAQLESRKLILGRRLFLWNRYREALAPLAEKELVRLPFVPEHCDHNGHIFYLICRSAEERRGLIGHLNQLGIKAVFHYVPLHTSEKGRALVGNISLPVTEDLAARLVRLPLFYSLTEGEQDRVIDGVKSFFSRK